MAGYRVDQELIDLPDMAVGSLDVGPTTNGQFSRRYLLHLSYRAEGHYFMDGESFVTGRTKPHLIVEVGLRYLNNPAATYSPTQLPMQYHRPGEA